jgi:hypothetical protein
MADDRHTSAMSSAQYVELSMLRLGAIVIDLRGQLTPHERARAPSLAAVLDACDALFEELGWGRPAASLPEAERAGRRLQ